MYLGRTVAVVMPAFNVADRIAKAVCSLPELVDHLVVVNDGSTDRTGTMLERLARPGRHFITHPRNRGVGAAIATGYAEALRQGADVIAVMAGDGQMDPADLEAVLEPVVRGAADYVKGNRFRHREVWRVMPRDRLLGNILLSLVTKLTSGYWRVWDSQCGYTAISGRALRALGGRFFGRYGYPNDLLARLRTIGARLQQVPVRPVYEGQRSGIRPWTLLYPILFVLLASLGRRLWQQRLRRLLLGAGVVPLPPLPAAEASADHLLTAPPR